MHDISIKPEVMVLGSNIAPSIVVEKYYPDTPRIDFKIFEDLTQALNSVKDFEFTAIVAGSDSYAESDSKLVTLLREGLKNRKTPVFFIAYQEQLEKNMNTVLEHDDVEYILNAESCAVLLAGRIKSLLNRCSELCSLNEHNKELEVFNNHCRDAFDSMPIGYVSYKLSEDGKEFIVTSLNKFTTVITGISEDGAVGKSLIEAFPHLAGSGLQKIFRRVLETGKSEFSNERTITGSGEDRWFRDHVYRMSSGEVAVLFSDITEIMHARLELKKSEDMLKAALDVVNDGVWSWDLENDEMFFSPRFFEMLGYSEGELEHSRHVLRSLVYPDDIQALDKKVENDLKKGKSYSIEIRMKHKDGGLCWILSRGRACEFDSEGLPTRAVGTHVDITSQKESELKIRKSESSLAAAQRIANMGSWELIPGAERMEWSDHTFELFGYHAGEIVPTVDFLRSLVIPAERHKINEILSCSLRDETSRQAEFRVRRADGVVRNFLSVVSSDCASESASNVFHGVFLDITKRKRAEEHLIEQQTILDSILTGIKAAFLIVDPDTMEILDSNEQAADLFGLDKEQILSSRCQNLLESDLCDIEDFLDEDFVGEGSFLDRELTFKGPDGNIIPISLSRIELLMDGAPCFALILFDITEKKSLERQLSFAQKLEAVGQLAAGIAHEINTPIQYIGGNLSYLESTFEKVSALIEKSNALKEELSDSSELKSASSFLETLEEVNSEFIEEEFPMAIKDSLHGVEQVASIVLAMKKFSHPEVEEKTAVDINDAVSSVVTVAKNEWKYASELNLNLGDNIPLVMCNPGEINQAVLNVLVNAAHTNADKMKVTGAMGKIDISTRVKKNFVEISISDTGNGIKDEDADKIFDPFFTTKEVGKGTGQGLSITYSIMEKNGGSIDFKSKLGEGTVFTLRVPIAENS
ncbi:PAS domain S-box protein [Maridesulfovibrio bastinii]|uniref:PAS domain S-box protein n=1 Tax=Maridesulfovibrio bastinii TaxID=47157 RepID=UPI00040B3BF5|nr:PAS domain S-box protein [Maridesulfovibrio bastinii]